MPTKFFFRGFWIVALISVFLSTQGVIAETDCVPDEHYAPIGRIVDLGERSFRICSGDVIYFPGSEKTDRIRISHHSSHVAEILDQFEEIKFLWGELRFQDLDFVYPSQKNNIIYDTYVGNTTLAGANYEHYTNRPLSSEQRNNFDRGIIGSGLLVYTPDGEATVLPHFLSCRGDLKGTPRSRYSCFVYVSFDKPDRLVAYTRFFWAPDIAAGVEPFDFDNLHILIEALAALFESVEVTGQ